MRKIRKNRGITLISLVVTIIVLLILAGITINMLFGENGLLNRATEATEEYSKSEARERVELLLSEYTIEKATGENMDFAKFLRKNLQVGVAQNEDDTYSFMLGEWQIVTTESKVISIEKFKLDVDKTYSSVASMKADTELTEGQLVQTEGYWDEQYGGGAYYDIVSSTSLTADDGKCIQLDNGLYAELHAINDTVTVNQFGAYGDGEHDDAEAIESALNSKYGNISFESEKYRLARSIKIYTSNIAILGNDKIVYTDDNYSGSQYYAITINSNFEDGTNVNSEMLYNIELFNLNIETRGKTSDYSIQMRVYNVTNLSIENCNFTVQEIENNKDRRITNMWIYTGWHNVNIEGCKFINKTLCSSGAGGVWISEMNPEGQSDNLMFKNNYMDKSGHDEILAIYGYNIKDIVIEENEIYSDDTNVDNPSDKNIWISGYEDGNNIQNILITRNTIRSNTDGIVIDAENIDPNNGILVSENNIFYSVFDPIWGDEAFRLDDSSQECLKIENNYIEYNSINESDEFVGLGHNIILDSNNIVINADVQQISNSSNKYYNNVISINGKTRIIARDIVDFNNNELNLKGNINLPECMFFFNNTSINNDINIEKNNFSIETTEISTTIASTFVQFSNTNINGYTININGNIIKTNENQQTNQVLLQFSQNTENTSQVIYLFNNDSKIYTIMSISENVCNPIIKTDSKE